jgi:hypothetical protein
MEADSFKNQNNPIIANMSQNLDVDYDALTSELHSCYIKYKDSNNKKQLIRGLLQKTVLD